MRKLKVLFRYYFNLDSDKANEAEIIASITQGISFRGSNLWTLVFAVIIASVGLNVNSSAVIIGAMLISPLMGPVMGVGLGLGIADFDLVRRGIKNLLIAVLFSIATSALYFYISPLKNPASELLAQTTPTIWDVFIAFAGGLAGVIGATRRSKGNVIPGVAIATALMPPLCTVGYGLATRHWYFSLGAFYLFFINSVFICTATVLIVRFLRLPRRQYESAQRRRRVNLYLALTALVTFVPSVWLASRIVQKAVFETAAQNFVRGEFTFHNTQVINKAFVYDPKQSKIDLLLIGEELDSAQIAGLQRKLPAYGMRGKTQLLIRQGLNAQKEFDLAQIKASVMSEFFKPRDTASLLVPAFTRGAQVPDISAELRALYPQLRSYSLGRTVVHSLDSLKRADSIYLFIASSDRAVSRGERQQLERWIRNRFPGDSVDVVLR